MIGCSAVLHTCIMIIGYPGTTPTVTKETGYSVMSLSNVTAYHGVCGFHSRHAPTSLCLSIALTRAVSWVFCPRKSNATEMLFGRGVHLLTPEYTSVFLLDFVQDCHPVLGAECNKR